VGQASVEIVAVLPALISVASLVAYLLLLGYSWIEARGAARIADRGSEVGTPASQVTKALPPILRTEARVRAIDSGHEVSVVVPVPGGPMRVRARSR